MSRTDPMLVHCESASRWIKAQPVGSSVSLVLTAEASRGVPGGCMALMLSADSARRLAKALQDMAEAADDAAELAHQRADILHIAKRREVSPAVVVREGMR